MAAISPANATTAASLSLPQFSSTSSSLSSSSSPSFLNFKTATVSNRCVKCGVRSLENPSGHRSLDFLSNGDPISLINQNSSSPITMAAAASESGAKSSKRVCLFHSDETRDLAERIVAKSDCIELRSINWK